MASSIQKAMIEALEEKLLHSDLDIFQEQKIIDLINKIKKEAAATK